MALTKEITYSESEIKHVMGDQYSIPVTLKIMDGATEVFSKTIDVEHKTNRTIDTSINCQIVKNKFEKAIESFNGVEDIKNLSSDITTSLGTLKESLSLEKVKL